MYHREAKKRVNSRKYSPVDNFETEQEVIDYMKRNNLRIDHIPYIFTHIALSDRSILTQDYNGIICSPQKLASMLQNQGF